MANNLYRIEVQARVESPQIDGSCMIYTNGGIVFAKIHPVNIKATPKVDAVEVKHGRWEKYRDDDADGCCRCTACGWHIAYEDCSLEELGYNYCPNCGAKMDRE